MHMCVCSLASRSLATLSCDSSYFFFAFIFLLCDQSYLKNRYYSGLTFSL